MKSVRKAIIPAAGLGTRFLPVTKTVPKEMLPIVDTPSLLYVIEEAVSAGIEDIVLISGRQKTAIEDFFDRSVELESILEKTGKLDLLSRVLELQDKASIISTRQKEALGLGHAVHCGYKVVGNEPFAVLLPDELMIGRPGVISQLVTSFTSTGLSSVSIMEVPDSEVSKYGIVDVEKASSGIFKIKNIVEKPSLKDAPSRYALPGRYVFTPTLFKYLENSHPGKNGEIQLTDGMCHLAKDEGLLGLTFTAKRYDTGDKLGFLQANIEMALENQELSTPLKTYLKNLVGGWS